MTGWHEEPISKRHNRDAFDCGEEALNEFLRRYARKSHELGGAKTFLAIRDDNQETVLGYYSLCPASIEYARTPEILRRGLARYDLPAFRLARLAVDRSVQGQGLVATLRWSWPQCAVFVVRKAAESRQDCRSWTNSKSGAASLERSAVSSRFSPQTL